MTDGMTETNDKQRKSRTLSLGNTGKLSIGGKGDGAQVRQSFSHGRSKTVQVEVKRKRHVEQGQAPGPQEQAPARRPADGGPARDPGSGGRGRTSGRALTQSEREARERALRDMLDAAATRKAQTADASLAEADVALAEPQSLPVEDLPTVEEPPPPLTPDELRAREVAELQRIEDDERKRLEAERARLDEEAKAREEQEERQQAERRASQAQDEARQAIADRAGRAAAAKVADTPEQPAAAEDESAARGRRGSPGKAADAKRPAPVRTKGEPRRRAGKLTVVQALDEDSQERTRSLASVRRARERERREQLARQSQEKIVRDVIIPETITVQELANRMATRGADVIKAMMKMGMMATITQSLDGDTAELVVEEFGHRVKRVSESDVLIGFGGEEDLQEDLLPRPPVVTVMGHVDHGKTSLLDALRSTDVAAGEAGGITQHIGAYQVLLDDGSRITFIDTPGHAAFTEMRARGARTTDVVILVVAADDGVMPQTVEAIRHARAAEVPIVVAVNKCDLPDANPDRVRQELLQYEVVVEDMGGEVQSVEVSAKSRLGLDTLQEAILLQAEILELKANPSRPAEGVVVEAKLDRGRGSVATVLVQRGTLRIGDIFVAGSEWGRVRALLNDRGDAAQEAGPSMPVEVLGFNGTPLAGDDFVVVDNEARAREVSEFRARKKREATQVAQRRGTLEQMFAQAQAGEQVKNLPIVIKGDVQGSVEAITAALTKLTEDNDEVNADVLHAAVGGITESDVTLANASDAMVIGFNVRANPQAREMARRDGTEIRYYNVIYDVIDDVRNALTGLLAPIRRETHIGNAEIREVFNISKIGKVAGCYVTEGVVKRGAGVRLLRDNVVIHEGGTLKTLKRFKDEVRDVHEGFECGMAFENYENIQVGDIIECYEVEEVAQQL